MALHKTIAVGTQVRVKSLNANTAGLGTVTISGDLLPFISLRGDDAQGVIASAGIGDILTIVRQPKKIGKNGVRINVCRVENSSGIQGEVFWTELRSNCEVIDESKL